MGQPIADEQQQLRRRLLLMLMLTLMLTGIAWFEKTESKLL